MNRTEPKFRIAEIVAVYCYFPGTPETPKIIIPKTRIVDRTWVDRGTWVDTGEQKGRIAHSGWFYAVADHVGWIREDCLRPWFPGDYEDETEDELLEYEA